METVMAINHLSDPKKPNVLRGTAIVVKAGCLDNCEPRPEVRPKCAHRAEETSLVQGKRVHRCID